jgi:hypothetical protein
MAKDPVHLAGFEAENTGGLLAGILAEEDEFDRRSLWRLGSWGVAAVGAVILALLTNQTLIGSRRDQVAAVDLVRQSQQIQSVAKESQNEARRLASAIDTLNGDRDRLYSRVTVLEQGLDSATGAITRQTPAVTSQQALPAAPATPSATTPSSAAPPPPVTSSPATLASTPLSSASVEPPAPATQTPSPPPVTSPVAAAPAKTAEKPNTNTSGPEPSQTTASTAAPTTPPPPAQPPATPAPSRATSLVAPKLPIAPPDSVVAKLIEPDKPASAIIAAPMPEVVASSPTDDADTDSSPTLPKVALQRTEFGVDVGGAHSVGGLRALWRGLLKWRSNAPLAGLQPIIVVKENSTGLGMQLRLVAGPFSDAAAAAKICAAMIESQRTCETAVFDGQRLAMKPEEPPVSAKSPVIVKPTGHRHSSEKRSTAEEPPKKPESTGLSSFFSGS